MYECRECIYIHTFGSYRIRPMFMINSVMYATSNRTAPNKWKKKSYWFADNVCTLCIHILLSSPLNIRSSSFSLNERQHPIIFHIFRRCRTTSTTERMGLKTMLTICFRAPLEQAWSQDWWLGKIETIPTQVFCFWAGWKYFGHCLDCIASVSYKPTIGETRIAKS